jgi:hypothetical protein
MNKAAELSANLESLDIAEGMKVIEACYEDALHFDVIKDAMCIMHVDGSANIIEFMGGGSITVQVISSANILKVLQHYRPFKDVFKGGVQ